MIFARSLWLLAVLALFSQYSWPTNVDAANPLQLPVTGLAQEFLLGIELQTTDHFAADDTQVVVGETGIVTVNLGLGETMNKTLLLQPRELALEFKVEHSYETSLTLMNEGPHMDLLAWKHHTADWRELDQNSDTTFTVREVSSTLFPEVNSAEIIDAAREESAKWAVDGVPREDRWVNLAGECKTPNDYPCGVSISKVFLRVMAKVTGQWQQILLIEFIVPMGC